MARETVLTPQGLEELKTKIEYLRNDRRREVAERIKEAREFGDISENSEYDDAKNEQAMLEKQIADLEERLASARVIDEKSVDTETVGVGATVHVKDQKTDKSQKFKIVGSAEADPVRRQALQRVARRPRAARPQARRDRHRARCPRGPGPQAQDHQDRALAGPPVVSPPWTTAGPSSSACASRASTPSRTSSTASRRSPTCTPRTTASPTARRPTPRTASPAA